MFYFGVKLPVLGGGGGGGMAMCQHAKGTMGILNPSTELSLVICVSLKSARGGIFWRYISPEQVEIFCGPEGLK